MQVDSLATALAQITVASANSGESQKALTGPVVDAILKVCEKVGIKCTLETP
jgi:hypothetical protein